MAKIEMMSEAAWELCNAADIPNDKRHYYYHQNDKGNWEFVWESDVTQPFTLTQLKTKANELWAAEPLAKVRRIRDQLLKECDWTQGADVPDAIKTAWITYRQKLRDMPKDNPDAKLDATDGSLSGVTWPTKPGE